MPYRPHSKSLLPHPKGPLPHPKGLLPLYPGQLTVALFGKRAQLKTVIGKMILSGEHNTVTKTNNFDVKKNDSFKIISTPDIFEQESLHPDQDIIDFMALSHPGPHLFILAIDSENTEEEKIVAQISKLQHTFGERITEHLVVTLPDIESFQSLSHLKERFHTRCNDHPPYHHGGADADPMSPSTSKHDFAAPVGAAVERHIGNSSHRVPDNIFNIVLLGLSGTGKSASANTILAAEKAEVDSGQLFKSQPSSVPVTTQCEVKIMEKPFGVQVRLVDTPDFFHDQLKNSQAHVEDCKKYCQPGQCVFLLVIQLGRFTDAEEGILEKLEDKLGWKIRESTIVLLTRREDLKGSLEDLIETCPALKNIVELCDRRYHLFNNTSKDTKQVIELIKKIPNWKNTFPKIAKKNGSQCCLC
ncbi:GTPase IMAP family member 8-like isoform X2 [Dicentrarchus labrax]|uniref:GTPase IMAP family member 8-like isoform X2 n=1 Tax=Dicentrarchus labrax TaxID=13489 RepID=UPI0021F5FA84|nr:GTPase IMAP family member 8-like isoform X2 [Dicentrarchus labrax]